MKYIVENSMLYADDGEFIKHLDCPINKRWDNLAPLKNDYLRRHCNECHKDVINISMFTDDQVKAIVMVEPDVCFYVRSGAYHIEFVGESSHQRNNLCVQDEGMYRDCRVVRTVRDIKAINSVNNDPDYFAIVQHVEENDEISSKATIRKNKRTGEIEFGGADYRNIDFENEIFWYHPRKYASPIAAYVVPYDIKKGERVFVPDVIQEYVGDRWNQGDTYKLKSSYAVWNGYDLYVEVDRPSEFVG